jgi:hypothetical protein
MYMYLRNDFEGHSFFLCKTKFVAKPEFQNWRAFRFVYVVVLRHCACIFSARARCTTSCIKTSGWYLNCFWLYLCIFSYIETQILGQLVTILVQDFKVETEIP